MRTHIILSSLVLTCVVVGSHQAVEAGQQQKYGVTVNTVKPAELAKARTYVWTVSQPAFNKDADKQIIAAVDRELSARGFTKLASGSGDLMVTYGALRRTDVNLESKAGKGEVLPEYAVGTLVVDLRDASNRESLFRVRMDTPIDAEPAKLEAIINAAVTAMFEKYPAAKR